MARRWLVNAFIVFNVLLLLVWDFPKTDQAGGFARLAAPYLDITGLSQSWPMFAWPRGFNFHVVVAVVFDDGGAVQFQLPWDPTDGVWTRYRKSRYYLKWMDAVGLYGAYPNPNLWRAYAQYLARSYNRPSNPVRYVAFTCWWSGIPPPDGDWSRPAPPESNAYTFFTYAVQPGDVQ